MSRVALTPQSMSVAGLNPIVFTSPTGNGTANGWSFPNDGRTFLLVKNAAGDASTRVTTPVANGTKALGAAVTVPTETIADGNIGIVWLPKDYFNDSTGSALVDVNTAAGCTAAAIQMPGQFQ